MSWFLNSVLNVYYLTFDVAFHFESGVPVIEMTEC